jgi:hypothetical protein
MDLSHQWGMMTTRQRKEPTMPTFKLTYESTFSAVIEVEAATAAEAEALAEKNAGDYDWDWTPDENDRLVETTEVIA